MWLTLDPRHIGWRGAGPRICCESAWRQPRGARDRSGRANAGLHHPRAAAARAQGSV